MFLALQLRDEYFSNFIGTENGKVRVIINSIREKFVFTLRKMQMEFFRSFHTVRHFQVFCEILHIKKRHFQFGGDQSRDQRIIPMSIKQHAFFVEFPPRNR